eukprot:s803_g10.t1
MRVRESESSGNIAPRWHTFFAVQRSLATKILRWLHHFGLWQSRRHVSSSLICFACLVPHEMMFAWLWVSTLWLAAW